MRRPLLPCVQRTRLPRPFMVNASSLTLIPVLPGRDERVQQGFHKTFHPRLTCSDDGGYAVEPRLRDFLRQIEGIMQNLNWCSTKKPSCRLMCDTFKPRLKEARTVEALSNNRKARKGFLVTVLTEHTMQSLHNSTRPYTMSMVVCAVGVAIWDQMNQRTLPCQ